MSTIELLKNPNNGPFFIGEIGQNHNGNLSIAIELAAQIGGTVSVVKTVYRHPKDKLTNKPYGGMHSFSSDYIEHRDNLDLSIGDIVELGSFVTERTESIFGCSFYGPGSLSTLIEKGLKVIKFPSRVCADKSVCDNCLNIIYSLSKEEREGLIVGASFGMCDEARQQEITNRMLYMDVYFDIGFHTTSAYPTQLEECNLSYVEYMKNNAELYHAFGFSCHHVDSFIPDLVAVGLGAKWFERHITLDTGMRGRDHLASIPAELTGHWCRTVRNGFIALGSDNVRKISPGEMATKGRMLT